jgi:hypothetical protein
VNPYDDFDRFDEPPYCPIHGVFEECQECEHEHRERERTLTENLWWLSTQPEGGFTYEENADVG